MSDNAKILRGAFFGGFKRKDVAGMSAKLMAQRDEAEEKVGKLADELRLEKEKNEKLRAELDGVEKSLREEYEARMQELLEERRSEEEELTECLTMIRAAAADLRKSTRTHTDNISTLQENLIADSKAAEEKASTLYNIVDKLLTQTEENHPITEQEE